MTQYLIITNKVKKVLYLVTKEDLLYLFNCHLLEEKNTERPQNSYFELL